MDAPFTLICVVGLLFLLSGSAHSKCPTNDTCEKHVFEQITGKCMPLSIANKNPNECPKDSCPCPNPGFETCCKSCKTVDCDKKLGFVCMTEKIAAKSTWFDYKKDCKVGDNFCETWWEPCLCCPKKPSMEDTCLDKECKEAFDRQGICVNIHAADWNLNPDIDLTKGMKLGLCSSTSSTNKGFYCGCFKKKEEAPACMEDNKKCKCKRNKVRKCYKENKAPSDYFFTGILCNDRRECKCYQKCKPNKKCIRINGSCIAEGQEAPHGWVKRNPCDKNKKCICYTQGKTSGSKP